MSRFLATKKVILKFERNSEMLSSTVVCIMPAELLCREVLALPSAILFLLLNLMLRKISKECTANISYLQCLPLGDFVVVYLWWCKDDDDD